MFLRILLQLCRLLAVGSCRKKKPELGLFPLLHSFPFLPLLLSNSRGRCRLTPPPPPLILLLLLSRSSLLPLSPVREKEKNFLAGNLLIFSSLLFPFLSSPLDNRHNFLKRAKVLGKSFRDSKEFLVYWEPRDFATFNCELKASSTSHTQKNGSLNFLRAVSTLAEVRNGTVGIFLGIPAGKSWSSSPYTPAQYRGRRRQRSRRSLFFSTSFFSFSPH